MEGRTFAAAIDSSQNSNQRRRSASVRHDEWAGVAGGGGVAQLGRDLPAGPADHVLRRRRPPE